VEMFLRLVTQRLAVTYLLMLSLPVSATTNMVWSQGYLVMIAGANSVVKRLDDSLNDEP